MRTNNFKLIQMKVKDSQCKNAPKINIKNNKRENNLDKDKIIYI